jgi:hypothetical protein
MRPARLGPLLLAAGLALGAPAEAASLLDALRATGLRPPTEPAALLARPVVQRLALDLDAGVWVVTRAADGELLAARFDRAGGRWLVAALGPPAAPAGEAPEPRDCGGLQEIWPWGRAGGVRVTTHVTPSAGCTLVVSPAVVVVAVLGGWPVAEMDERLIVHRSQAHFAPVHPLELLLWDPRRGQRLLHPLRPYQAARLAHVARARAAYTPAFCQARNHPCDPERFDERLVGEVAVNPAAGAVAFAVQLDNAAFWPEAELERLEAFRELRAALARPAAAAAGDAGYRVVADALARLRALGPRARVAEALAGDPGAAALVAEALAEAPRADEAARAWLLRLDPRWGGPGTWRRLARAIEVPDEAVELVYVYRGLDDPATTEFRELTMADFRARFGPGPLGRALAPEALRRLFETPAAVPRSRGDPAGLRHRSTARAGPGRKAP